MRKLSQSGISTAQLAVVLVVVIVVAGASAVMLLKLGGPVRNAMATVRLHDAETINLSDYENSITRFLPPGASIGISGTLTVNTFSATNITVKLHNKTTDEWITIVEDQTIADMTTANDFSAPISAGTYDKVSVYLGTIIADVSWTEITVNFINVPNAPDTFTAPAGGFDNSFAINYEFVISFGTEVVVTEGEHKVFDVDIGPPLNPATLLFFGYKTTGEPGREVVRYPEGGPVEYLPMVEGEMLPMDVANMSARGL